MTPQIWILAGLLLFVISFIGQLIRENHRPWLLSLVALGGFAMYVLVFTQFALPRMQEAGMRSIQEAAERGR